MAKWCWIAPLLAAAAWAQTRPSVIPSGTELKVRMDETLSASRNQGGDRFTATLTSPVVVDGQTVVPVGTPVTGHVLESREPEVYKERAGFMLSLDSFALAGRSYRLEFTAASGAATIQAGTVVTFTLGEPVRI
jgi:hypothetical protein